MLLKRRPFAVPSALWALRGGREAFKQRIAAETRLPVHLLPWRADFVAWLREQRAAGRRLILATAAHESIAAEVARELELFDAVIATNTKEGNLKGAAKLAAIRARVGDRFSYAGDDRADLPIWASATSAVVVGAREGVARKVRAAVAVEREFPSASLRPAVWLRALRVHQWVKNLLLFVPLLTSFSFLDPGKVLAALAAFVAFSLAASGTYLLNDMWDLDSDRQHARKRYRPVASGVLKLSHALGAAAGLLAAALLVALATSPALAAALIGYVALTTAYSGVLKKYVVLDVLALALLYTYRVLAGAIAIEVLVTPWLLAFSAFTFLSLALVKRCAELVAANRSGQTELIGRNYLVSDLVILWPLCVGSSLSSVVVFGLYVYSPDARAAYGGTGLLWLAGAGLIYWTARMWIKTARGEMHDDPIVFALWDRGSRMAIFLMIVVPVFANFLWRLQLL